MDSTDETWVGVVMGASVLPSGQPSGVLQQRLDTALRLYKSKKIGSILVSGDNREANYNEPKVMRNYLVDNGVSASKITVDPGGTRTIDTCERAKKNFNLDKIVIVSQAFHLPRSNFLCSRVGLKAKLAVAPDPSFRVAIYGVVRELPASYLSLKEILAQKLLYM